MHNCARFAFLALSFANGVLLVLGDGVDARDLEIFPALNMEVFVAAAV
jgi:hypothetical protein